jgi:hypothetical protein
MLRLHSYILWSMLKFFHKKSQHYILCMIYIYKRGGTHIVEYIQFFFSKTYFTKSVRNVKIAFLYIMKHVKILSYKVTTLHSMHDIYIYIYFYIYISGGRHTYSCMYSSFVQCQTYSRFNLVLFRCKKSRNLFSIFIIFST